VTAAIRKHADGDTGVGATWGHFLTCPRLTVRCSAGGMWREGRRAPRPALSQRAMRPRHRPPAGLALRHL